MFFQKVPCERTPGVFSEQTFQNLEKVDFMLSVEQLEVEKVCAATFCSSHIHSASGYNYFYGKNIHGSHAFSIFVSFVHSL